MAHNCENCKFHDIDYEWDDNIGDEVSEEICLKHHNIFLHLPIKCPYFEKYKPKPYVEKFNECDTCEYVNQCEADGYVIECTAYLDNHRHYIKGIGCYCRKENGALEDKKLSEIIEMSDKLVNANRKATIKLLQTAIDKFGDITYGELLKDKIHELF